MHVPLRGQGRNLTDSSDSLRLEVRLLVDGKNVLLTCHSGTCQCRTCGDGDEEVEWLHGATSLTQWIRYHDILRSASHYDLDARNCL